MGRRVARRLGLVCKHPSNLGGPRCRSIALTHPAWCPPAPCCARASERRRAMTADVTPGQTCDRAHPGSTHTAFVDGSRLCWAWPSPVHEGLGYRASEPDRIQGDAVLPHASDTAQSRITSCRSARDRSSRPASLAPCSPPSRPLRAASGGGLRPALTAPARGAQQRSWSGRRNATGRTKKLNRELAML